MAVERTLSIIKPDAVAKNAVGQILSRFEAAGVLREELKLRGTKFGCGIAQCGACTVHIDGNPMRSCVTPVSAVEGRSVTTIEGLATPVGEALKTAWTEAQVPQCGYCQSGQIMQAAGLLLTCFFSTQDALA